MTKLKCPTAHKNVSQKHICYPVKTISYFNRIFNKNHNKNIINLHKYITLELIFHVYSFKVYGWCGDLGSNLQLNNAKRLLNKLATQA